MDLERRRLGALVLGVLAVMSCRDKPPEVAPLVARPKRLEPLERVVAAADGGGLTDAQFRVVPLSPLGPPVPGGAVLVRLDGEEVTVHGRPWAPRDSKGPIVLVPSADTYLAQAAGLLAQLDDAGAEVWLKHPDGPIAFRLTLLDEAAFQRWLDEPVPGKVRVVQREDGFEVMTNMGKLPGWDPNGPTVPLRGGQLDLTTLQKGLGRVHQRFPDAPDVCFLPAFGVELGQTARAMATDYPAADSPLFPVIGLVYPRPLLDAGK